jgi:hypothetical protein
MADVFISYKSERRNAAQHLTRILELNGYSVWFDYGLLSGRNFGVQIEREIKAAKAVVVLWCSLSRDSQWVLEEADLAKKLGTFTPAWLENIDLPLGFRLDHTIDLSVWDGDPRSHVLDGLLSEIARRVGRDPVPQFRGLVAYEQTWRSLGAPPLARFALITPVAEREARRLENDENSEEGARLRKPRERQKPERGVEPRRSAAAETVGKSAQAPSRVAAEPKPRRRSPTARERVGGTLPEINTDLVFGCLSVLVVVGTIIYAVVLMVVHAIWGVSLPGYSDFSGH